ncbi:ABC-F family ATP-binding cassette domain-containing protein [Algisphaera agarilytica]|uniref:ATP-binding cassette subfamily F protein uup n=1 Tax=Algisphaera agarilytica TaxID=1385975 RepID=A0A7X0LKH6_9BACT|nr:ABC-F family ATP-binding cassette domain-containing protein [Algisphaera agarilytica]MBB6428958.1 ATP-binding cassette subfamily F protein uup [Algisphaera agarilytica]
MATLLTARDLSKTYGTHTLFEGISLAIHDDERLALIGPNGSGKSTLLKCLAELETPDTGEFTRKKNLKLAYVAQSDHFAEDATPLSAVMDRLAQESGGASLSEDQNFRGSAVLSKLGFTDHNRPVRSLSGGWKKRLSIACALATEPDVLMLDEPTNHLDLEGVLWLESFVNPNSSVGFKGAMVFITHDRTFLEATATRIVELSRAYPGGTFEAKGNYTEFLRRKEDFLDAQAAQQSALAGKVRRDNAWLKQGIQGRQTRNKSQVDDAAARKSELKNLANRNNAPKQTATIDFQATERKTKRLLAAHNVSKTMGDKKLFDSLDLELGPGDRLGLLGPNGSGKTTLLRLLMGSVEDDGLQPDAGTVKPAAELRVVSFTQHREALNPTQKLREALCPVGDTVDYRGKPLHVASWAKMFLFDPGKFNTSVGDLSGGEQARVLIANLMLKPADLLILDEPTNDLDIPSLEVLEQALTEFPGAIVLVTHDRFMLDRLSTELLALDGKGKAKPYASYAQWAKDQAKRQREEAATKDNSNKTNSPSPQPPTPKPPKKLTYKLQRELNGMEAAILDAEAQLESLQAQSSDADIMADREKFTKVCQDLGDAQTKVETLYARWAELEELAGG